MKRDQYIYRTERVAGRVVRTYVGKVDSWQGMEYLLQQRDRIARREELRRIAEDWELSAVETADLRRLEVDAMRERGYTKTTHRHWRQGRK